MVRNNSNMERKCNDAIKKTEDIGEESGAVRHRILRTGRISDLGEKLKAPPELTARET